MQLICIKVKARSQGEVKVTFIETLSLSTIRNCFEILLGFASFIFFLSLSGVSVLFISGSHYRERTDNLNDQQKIIYYPTFIINYVQHCLKNKSY